MIGKKAAPCSIGASTARDVPFAAAAETRNVSPKRAKPHSGGTPDRLQIAFLMNAHGLTEAQAQAVAVLIWGAF